MSAATIDALRASLGEKPTDPAYAAKMLHAVPKADVVDRATFILERVKGKRVLEFGASGPMHDAIVKASAFCLGVDRDDAHAEDCKSTVCAHGCVVGFDLDDVTQKGLPGLAPDIIVCGEVLEHLSNPGWFLTRLKRQYPDVPVVVTVPNAFSDIGRSHLRKGIENVNRDHVAYYSYTTLKTLLERAGYCIGEVNWYNGDPYTAEGLIVVTE